MPCGYCDLCLRGEFRHCAATDVHSNPAALRYGNTPSHNVAVTVGRVRAVPLDAPATVLHRMPDSVSDEQSAMALPMGNGVQWAVIEGQAGQGRSLMVMGPGQQGLACVMAAKQPARTW